MDDFGTLARDFGFKPQGKSAPMAPPKAGVGSDGVDSWARSSSTSSSSILDDRNRDVFLFNDVFGGPPKYSSTSSLSEFDYDSIFKGSSTTSAANDSKTKPSSPPVYDKPVYDEDIFDGLPGLKSKSVSSSVRYEEDNLFAGISSPPNPNQKQSAPLDDFFENLGISEKSELKSNNSSRGLDDLIPGFGGSFHPGSNRPISEAGRPQKTTVNSSKPTSDAMEDPFVNLESTSSPAVSLPGIFTDPLEGINKLGNSGKKEVNGPSVSGGVFDDIDPLDGFGKSFKKTSPAFSSEINNRVKDGSPSRTGSSTRRAQTSATTEPIGGSSFWDSESHSEKMPTDNFQEFHQTVFDMPSFSTDSHKPAHQSASPFVNAKSNEADSQIDVSPEPEEQMETSDDVWLTVSEIPLFTQPTSAPAPSRPPPPIPARASKSETGFFTSNARKKGNEFSSSPRSTQYSPKPTDPPVKSSVASQIDELEDFAMGRDRNNDDEYGDSHSSEEVNTNSSAAAASAAAMKEAMERAEAKFRHAKEVREREYAKTGRSKEAVQLEKDEQAMQDDQDRLDCERRQEEEEEKERKRLEKERERERERERARVEREREKARQAVERATREARERAATDARERAAAEARLKSERAAVQRAQAEARERAAAEARERAEKAATDARERANAEAREKAAAAARAEAEARRRAERAAVERAAAEARERAAAAGRMNQQKNDNDLESFFSMGSRPSSAPRPRANSSDPGLDPQFQSKEGPDVARRTSSVSSSSGMRKASSTTNIVDDLTSIFGAAASSGEFQEFEGESEERRRARLERNQRTQERAAKALAEKNQRDLQVQREQEERHRMAETLDFEIKRWAAAKEGNLRALLSTLQYVLWPECGWQPVSLTDLIAGASVKKFYRKATLCIHPDKVQQKGATLQQKYIAEKVFDLLKEAWNKFNSEELF